VAWRNPLAQTLQTNSLRILLQTTNHGVVLILSSVVLVVVPFVLSWL
jgi:hypothetical protein